MTNFGRLTTINTYFLFSLYMVLYNLIMLSFLVILCIPPLLTMFPVLWVHKTHNTNNHWKIKHCVYSAPVLFQVAFIKNKQVQVTAVGSVLYDKYINICYIVKLVYKQNIRIFKVINIRYI